MGKELINKPLVEAILEIRWTLKGKPPEPQIDPYYKILLGRFFDRIITDYPEHEQLPTANLPDEILGHMVQHRFRIDKEKWPLVQLGPGILTINSTDDYRWSDFKPRAIVAVNKLFESHPKAEQFKISSLTLRYIDAVEYDYPHENALKFIKDNLKISISLPENLFDKSIENKPTVLSFQSSYKSSEPKGTVSVRIASGKKSDKPAIIWETTLKTSEENVPPLPDEFEKWIDSAHQITDNWFFKMIEGDLERRFSCNGNNHSQKN